MKSRVALTSVGRVAHGVGCEGPVGRGYVQRRRYEIGRGHFIVDSAVEVVFVHAEEVAFSEDEAAGIAPEAIDVKEVLPGFHD